MGNGVVVRGYSQVQRMVEDEVPESAAVEYKTSATISDIAQAICAIANEHGGTVVIGVTARDQLPEDIHGWAPSRNFDNGLTQYLAEKVKPKAVLHDLTVEHQNVPGSTGLLVTVITVPNAREPVWCTLKERASGGGEHGIDVLFYRRGSSTVRASLREEFLRVIQSKSRKAHELAEIEMDNSRYEDARRIYADMIMTDSLDFDAWMGKTRCDAFMYDGQSAIDSFKKAVGLDKELARGKFMELIDELEELEFAFGNEGYGLLDYEKDTFTVVEDGPEPEDESEVENLLDTISQLTSGFSELYPGTRESQYLQGKELFRQGERGKACDLLTEVFKSGEESSHLTVKAG